MAKAKTIRTGKLGSRDLRLVEKDGRHFGLADGKICAEGSDADTVWQQLHNDAGKSDPKYFGYSDARTRFLKFFPNGFHSSGFESRERNYKLAAKDKLETTVPLVEALDGKGFGEAILAVFRATNMLSPYEKTWLKDLLRGRSADAFVQAAANFSIEGTRPALIEVERVLKPHNCAKWTIATYLPFLWRSDVHMFLKPEATKDFAARVGHPLASLYEARLQFSVYESLLDLVNCTTTELSELRPRDRIDIQSFIWIVGDYREDKEGVYP